MDAVDSVLIPLTRFVHQVGGHTCMFCLSKSTVCKPLCDNESRFYNAEPEALKEFTPKYLGEVDVACQSEQALKTFVASVPKCLMESLDLEEKSRKTSPSFKNLQKADTHNIVDIENGLGSWNEECIERQITRYGFWSNNSTEKFIVLENLVHEYIHPSMLDIKLGTRQYRDDPNCSLEKRKLLEDRCANTTSATLGFRICGMQVYQASTHKYLSTDKYYGRTLTELTVVDEFKQFLHDGNAARFNIAERIVNKLEKLTLLLEQQHQFILSSCSILLMYDGGQKSSNSEKQKSMVTSKTKSKKIVYSEPELPTLSEFKKAKSTKFSENIHLNRSELSMDKDNCKKHSFTLVPNTEDTPTEHLQESNVKPGDCKAGGLRPRQTMEDGNIPSGLDRDIRVDVRLIDFAQVKVRDGNGGDKVNDDEGVILGLNNILSILKSLINK